MEKKHLLLLESIAKFENLQQLIHHAMKIRLLKSG